jgi:hypothetical protein
MCAMDVTISGHVPVTGICAETFGLHVSRDFVVSCVTGNFSKQILHHEVNFPSRFL